MNQSVRQAAKILGLDDSYSLESLERVYGSRLADLSKKFKESGNVAGGTLPRESQTLASLAEELDPLGQEFEELHWAYKILFDNLSSGGARRQSQDAVVSAELFPGLELDLVELGPNPNTANVFDLRERNGAMSAGLDSEASRSSLLGQGRINEIEALIGMSEVSEVHEDRPALDLIEDEEVVIDRRDLGVFLEESFEPRKIKSIIGEGQKEVVNISTANSRLRSNRDAISRILSQKQVDGSLLVQLREQMGVSRDEVSLRTKVHVRHIEGLEKDDYTQMPALVYFKGYISAYLRYLGIENQELVHLFAKRYQDSRAAQSGGG